LEPANGTSANRRKKCEERFARWPSRHRGETEGGSAKSILRSARGRVRRTRIANLLEDRGVGGGGKLKNYVSKKEAGDNNRKDHPAPF